MSVLHVSLRLLHETHLSGFRFSSKPSFSLLAGIYTFRLFHKLLTVSAPGHELPSTATGLRAVHARKLPSVILILFLARHPFALQVRNAKYIQFFTAAKCYSMYNAIQVLTCIPQKLEIVPDNNFLAA